MSVHAWAIACVSGDSMKVSQQLCLQTSLTSLCHLERPRLTLDVFERLSKVLDLKISTCDVENHIMQPLGFFIWNKYFIECSSVPFWSLLLSRTYTDSFIWFSFFIKIYSCLGKMFYWGTGFLLASNIHHHN